LRTNPHKYTTTSSYEIHSIFVSIQKYFRPSRHLSQTYNLLNINILFTGDQLCFKFIAILKLTEPFPDLEGPSNQRMFVRLLVLCVLLTTSCYAYKGHHMAAADPNGPCDYSTGHGFVFFSPNVDSDCDSFVIYHLGELECPHQYIVAAEVTVQKNVRDLYCNKFKSGNETVFVVAPGNTFQH
jgi:hypothetical protein